MVKLEKVVTYPFKDEKWPLKLLIAFAMYKFIAFFRIIPVIGFVAYFVTMFYVIYLVYPGLFGSACAEAFGEVEAMSKELPPGR